MSEQLPYKDEQWSGLPLPDSEASWQKMKLLLENDKKRRVPFWWWKYAAIGLLLAGIGTAGWLWFGSHDKKNHLPVAVQKQGNVPKQSKEIVVPNSNEDVKTPSNSNLENNSGKNLGPQQINVAAPTPGVSNKQVKETAPLVSEEKNSRGSVKTKIKTPSETKIPSQNQNSKNLGLEKKEGNPIGLTELKKGSTESLPINIDGKKDSVKTKDTVRAIIAPPVVSNNDKKEEKKKKSSLVWSAGVGLQQAIAVNGQQSSSYNYKGQKSSLSDHIPSVYLRLQKGKWFAQAEFQYAVPQPVQNFYFSQKTRYDVANLSLNTERFTIQKLYYHQLPVSINYHLFKNLSVGAGGMYNILAGAVTQQEITSKNIQTGTETVTRNVAPVKGFKDSFLYKTTAGLLLQTDYHWKRFSLGLRYTQHLQPFIKYTKPDGAVLDEKTTALQAIVRFRLWSSK